MTAQTNMIRMNRRGFLSSATAAGAGLALSRSVLGQAKSPKVADVNVAMIGVGIQGSVLLSNLLKMQGIRMKGVCDIWPYRRVRAYRILKRYKHDLEQFEDYKEMLANVKDLDAVIIATPDWMHAEHAIACMKAGLHVYSEKEMSNTPEKAREMVKVAKETGKLLQVGHQRRSNPRYLKALEYIRDKKALGQVTYMDGHWNRHKKLKFTWNERTELDKATLAKYGYASMDEFRNWRWYRKFSGGPIADLGSHQVDVFNWFVDAPPKEIVATGGRDYYKTHEWYDNVHVLYKWEYQWQGKPAIARGYYKVLNTTSHNGYFESVMGDEGSMIVSENTRWGGIRREDVVDRAPWETSKEMLAAIKASGKKITKEEDKTEEKKEEKIDEELVGHSEGREGRYYPIPMPPDWELPAHRWHLENFFAAVRDPKNVKLNCPGEIGFETCMSVLPVNRAMENGRPLEMKPEQFKA